LLPRSTGEGLKTGAFNSKWMDSPIGLTFQLWVFENVRTNTGWVRNFSGPLPWPARGHKLKEQSLENC